MRSLFVVLVCFLLVAAVFAGGYNEVVKLGDFAPSWKDLPGVDGENHSLADLKTKDVVVLVFTCNSCPAAEEYEDRIIALTKKYAAGQGRAAVVAINVNTIPEDRLPEMKKRAKDKEFPFTYLYDETQKIAKAYGATYTPEFFVLDKQRKIIYMGAMDDRDQPANVKKRFVEDAIEAALKGERAATGETLARGCRIRWNRK